MNKEIEALEAQVYELWQKLARLRREAGASELPKVPDYTFETVTGPVNLSSLFAGKDTLFAIHNMGQGCRYCTLWADGLNGFLPHLEDRFAVVLLSKDAPELQQRFAHERGWRYRMASHGGGAYMEEQAIGSEGGNMPGMVCYQLREGIIHRRNATYFGPGDQFCSIWHILSLAGLGEEDWTPQYTYWKKPALAQMEDGGENVQ